VLKRFDLGIIIPIILLLILSFVVLTSVSSSIFPSYYWYYVAGVLAFLFFSLFDFEIISVFSKYLYILSILLLVATLIIGQVTRGTIRWIPIASLSIQPSEIVRPFLLIFFANFLASRKLSSKRMLMGVLLASIPLFFILIQPSLGVSVLTAIGITGVFLASDFNKKQLIYLLVLFVAMVPIGYKLLAPYQRERIVYFLNPSSDPLGSGYNSLQSIISVGSGKLTGRGLGRGVQTQLFYLPEKHTDFIFASVSEELGFLGSSFLILVTAVLFMRILVYMENSVSPQARAFLTGIFLTFFAQVFIHVGMNMGLLPITGIPYPLVSAGGSSLLATMASLGIVLGTGKK